MNQGLEAMGEFCKNLDNELGFQQIQIQQIQNELREMKHLNLPKFNYNKKRLNKSLTSFIININRIV